uniref:Retrotransposon gag domain-containing protein n=1 Tax=Cacopsylla melanoneura TaxID=428564 RepID=A0A8D8TDZ8_9HEMI
MTAQGLQTETEERKNAILLHTLGAEVLHIFKSFNVDIKLIKHEELLKKYEEYFLPTKNICMERHIFFSRKQKMEEGVDEFYTSLTNLSLSCEFGTLRESLVRDISHAPNWERGFVPHT